MEINLKSFRGFPVEQRDVIVAGVESVASADRAPGAVGGRRHFQSPDNVFTTAWLPFAVAGRMTTTVDAVFHIVLVNERRDTPV